MIIKIALSPNFGEFIVPDIFDGTLEEAKSTNGRIAIADYILNHHRERDIAIRGLQRRRYWRHSQWCPRRQTSGQVDCDDSANRHLKRSTRKSASSFFFSSATFRYRNHPTETSQ